MLAPGTRGEWDGFTIASPWVLKDVDRGATRYRMWYRGCYFRGRDRGCAIGHATSADGIRWQKTKGPVFEPADPGERRRLHGVTVVRSGDRYFLWYSVTPELFGPRKPSTLHLATSPDGLRWEAAGQVLATTERGPHAMEPSALHDGRQFHLWFLDSLRTFEPDDYELQEGAPFLMHFTSADGRAWQESGRFSLRTDRPRRHPRRRRTAARWWIAGYRLRELSARSLRVFRWQRLADRIRGRRATIERRSFSADVWDVTDATALESESGTWAWFVTQRQRGHEEIRVGMRRAK